MTSYTFFRLTVSTESSSMVLSELPSTLRSLERKTTAVIRPALPSHERKRQQRHDAEHNLPQPRVRSAQLGRRPRDSARLLLVDDPVAVRVHAAHLLLLRGRQGGSHPVNRGLFVGLSVHASWVCVTSQREQRKGGANRANVRTVCSLLGTSRTLIHTCQNEATVSVRSFCRAQGQAPSRTSVQALP